MSNTPMDIACRSGVWGAVVALSVLTAGCGNGGEAAAPPSTVTVTNQATDQPSDTAEPDETADWTGIMTARYDEATSPEAITGRDLMQQNDLLENMADSINESLKLPRDIPLIGSQCDEPNAFWDPTEKSMTICYEDAADGLDIYTQLGDPDPTTAALNAEWATFFHETGHMVIDLYSLPAVGREEDAADQLAALLLLAPGPDGQIDPDSVQAVKDFARAFEEYDARSGEIDTEQFADEHSMNLTRMYNLECWVYGSDPQANADLVTDGSLPQDRADRCEDEYEKLSESWSVLLGPYLK